jgi:hypothetical protein
MDKQAFFAQAKVKTKPFEMPNGDTITLRELTAGQRGELKDIAKDSKTSNARTVIMGCDLFSDDDVDMLCNMSGSLLDKMVDEILSLSGLTDVSVEETEKN